MKKRYGFTLVEIMIVVAIIGLLAAIAIPSFMKARTTSQAKACVNNLRQIESAKEQWAMAVGTQQGADIGDDIGNGYTSSNRTAINLYIKLQTTGLGTNGPVCPAKGDYDYMAIGTNAVCSVRSNANLTDPAAWHVLP